MCTNIPLQQDLFESKDEEKRTVLFVRPHPKSIMYRSTSKWDFNYSFEENGQRQTEIRLQSVLHT